MTLKEFMRLNKEVGNHWFSPATLEFFESKVHDFDEDSGIFITSECGPFGKGPRAYTIRKADFQTGRVSTVGKFQEYATLQKARTHASRVLISL